MISTVISGGQTGADQAGWRAAKNAGIRTDGWMPKGFLTEDGPRPEFEVIYGAREHRSSSYRDRTISNIRLADLTIHFGLVDSRGASLLREVSSRETHFVIWVRSAITVSPLLVSKAISQGGDHSVVNIAGNRESGNPGIGAWAESYLDELFTLIKDHK